jgi:hypothetical protein
MTKLMAELRTPGFNAELTLYSSGERYALAMNRTYMSAAVHPQQLEANRCGNCDCGSCECESYWYGGCRCCCGPKGCERTFESF